MVDTPNTIHARATRPAVAATLMVAALTAAAGPASAQQDPDSLRTRLDSLQARVDSLDALVRRLGPGGEAPAAEPEDPLAALRAAARAAAGGGGGAGVADTVPGPDEPPVFASRQRSLQALNPEISVTGDLLGHVDVDHPRRENFVPREFEFAFQSSLDPFSRAKIFAGLHNHGPELEPFPAAPPVDGGGDVDEGHGEEGPEFDVEEGYVEWVGVAGGLNLKLGKFFQRFGTLNRWHSHALPFQSRQLPAMAFIGEEPLAQAGVSATWLLPVHGFGTYEVTGEVTRSSNDLLWGESRRPGVLGHLNAFWQLGEASDLDLGLSWAHATYEDDEASFGRDLMGVEAAFTWRPPARAKYRELVVRGGGMRLDGLAGGEDGGDPGEGDALGLWALAETRVAQQWLVGGRLDWTENPADPDQTAWLVSPTLTWWQSEYVRVRLEYDLLGRSVLDDDVGKLWLQVTFAMGPHKHETY